MPALDFTAFPPGWGGGSKPAAPPAGSPGAPRQTTRTNASNAGPKGAKAGSPGAGDGEFGSLVDRLADEPEEGRTPSAGGSTRRSREIVMDGEERAAEPRAKKGDAGLATDTANDAPVIVAASNPTAFPWTLPLNPSLWNIEQVQVDGEPAGETGEAIEGESVIGAATTAIVDGAAGACVATLPGATDAETSAAFTVAVETPIAIHPATATTAAESAAPEAESRDAKVEHEGAVDASETFAWTGTAGPITAGPVAAGTGVNAAEADDNLVARTTIAGAGQVSAAVTSDPIGGAGFDSAIGQSASDALTNNQFEQVSSSVDPNDSALLAQSAMHAATKAAAVEGAPATMAADRTERANAAIDGPLPGDQAREQALIELQRAFESARANAPSTTPKHAANTENAGVIQTGVSGAAASDDAAVANAAARAAMAIESAAANAGDGSGSAFAQAIEASVDADAEAEAGANTNPNTVASATSASSRTRDNRQAAEDSNDIDNAITGASSWAAAAAAKYAEAAGGGASSGGGSDPRDRGSNAEAANVPAAARTSGETGTIAPVGFDARVAGASRAEHAATPAWAGESAIVTTAAPEEQASQIVRGMRLQWRGNTGEATLRLQPDHLGPVFVSVRVDQGAVSAMVRAETPAAQQWIQQHQQQLRDALDAQGLRVAQFVVTSNPDDRPRRDQEHDQNQDGSGRRFRPRNRNNGNGDRTFEITL